MSLGLCMGACFPSYFVSLCTWCQGGIPCLAIQGFSIKQILGGSMEGVFFALPWTIHRASINVDNKIYKNEFGGKVLKSDFGGQFFYGFCGGFVLEICLF